MSGILKRDRFVRASIRNELLAFFVACAVAGLLLLGYFDQQLGRMQTLSEQVNSAGSLRMLSLRVAELTRTAMNGDATAPDALVVARRDFDKKLADLRQQAPPAADSRTLDALAAAWAPLRELSRDLLARRPLRPPNAAESAQLNRLSEGSLSAAENNVQHLTPRFDAARRWVQHLLQISVALSIGLVVGLLIYIRLRLLDPLRALDVMLEKIAQGALDARVAVRHRDEIGHLLRRANHGAAVLARSRSKEQRALENLLDSETRHRTLWEISSDAIVTIDGDSIIRFANPTVERIFGYRSDELIGRNIDILQPERMHEAHRQGMERYKASKKRTVDWRAIEIKALHRNGSEIDVELSFSEMVLSKNTWFIGTFRDITDRKRSEEALQRSANFDTLTALPNRVLLIDRIEQALHNARRHDLVVGVLYLDLDNFKFINDSLGHDSGDELLRGAAQRLLACVREGDTVARVGGDEFVMLLSDMRHRDDIDHVARRALSSMAEPFRLAGGEGFVGASIGASLFPGDATTRAELLQHADIAMYRAKEYGRNNYQRYADHMQARAKLRMSMEGQLRRAIDAGELALHYQPQIDLTSGRVIGAEALLRWESSSLGRVSPAQFIPLAEETGLIVTIGNWVIDRACADVAGWRHAPGGADCRVAINLSPRQLTDAGVIDRIADALDRNALPANRVELEVTESLVMNNPEQSSAILQDLRTLGCHVALDDFGTGYSSLAYLRHLPLDVLKIDKSLISDIAIVRAVIQLARSFDLKTLAEGVEDEAILTLLRHLGCEIIQGYYFSKPLPLGDFLRFIATHEPASVLAGKPRLD